MVSNSGKTSLLGKQDKTVAVARWTDYFALILEPDFLESSLVCVP